MESVKFLGLAESVTLEEKTEEGLPRQVLPSPRGRLAVFAIYGYEEKDLEAPLLQREGLEGYLDFGAGED